MAARRCLALTQHAKLEMFGLLSYGVGRNTGVVTCTRQVGLEDLQEGSIWRDAVGISASQGPAVFEPCDLGLWVACMQRGEASEMLQTRGQRLLQDGAGDIHSPP